VRFRISGNYKRNGKHVVALFEAGTEREARRLAAMKGITVDTVEEDQSATSKSRDALPKRHDMPPPPPRRQPAQPPAAAAPPAYDPADELAAVLGGAKPSASHAHPTPHHAHHHHHRRRRRAWPVAVGVLVMLLLVGGAVALTVMLTTRPAGVLGANTRYVPNDAAFIAFFNVQSLADSQIVAAVPGKPPGWQRMKLPQIDVDLGDVQTLFIAGKAERGVMVVELAGDRAIAELLADAETYQIDGKPCAALMTPGGAMHATRLGGGRYLVATTKAMLTDALRGQGFGTVPSNLLSQLTGAAEHGNYIVVDMQNTATPPLPIPIALPLQQVRNFSVGFDLSDHGVVDGVIKFTNPDEADAAFKQMRAGLQSARNRLAELIALKVHVASDGHDPLRLIDALRLSRAGDQVEVRIEVAASEMQPLFAMIPLLMGGPVPSDDRPTPDDEPAFTEQDMPPDTVILPPTETESDTAPQPTLNDPGADMTDETTAATEDTDGNAEGEGGEKGALDDVLEQEGLLE